MKSSKAGTGGEKSKRAGRGKAEAKKSPSKTSKLARPPVESAPMRTPDTDPTIVEHGQFAHEQLSKEHDSQPKRESVLERIQGLEFDPAEELQLAIEQRNLLIGAWHARQRLYEELFGKYDHVSPEYYGPPGALTELQESSPQGELGGTGDPGQPDLADQHLTILTYAPDPLRPYWTYVTAGLASPWVQQEPDEVSGFGCELMIKSPHRASWPPQVLRSLAFYIFNHAGTISPGVRISLNGPIDPATQSRIRNLFVWYADEAPDCWYQLPSGGFGIFTAIGITDDELMYAESVEEYGTWCIQEVLRKFGINQVSDPARQSVTTLENVDAIMQDIKSRSDSFRQSGLAGLM
jgi:hypothetical protein